MVSDKKESSSIKPIVDNIEQRVMFAEKSWGSYQIINIEEKSVTIKEKIKNGSSMTYHSHSYRDEIWVIIQGSGVAVLDGIFKEVHAGDTLSIKAGCKHTIKAIDDLEIIEIQLGNDINVEDKQKFEFDFGNNE